MLCTLVKLSTLFEPQIMGAVILALHSIQFFITCKLIQIKLLVKKNLKQNGMQMMDGKRMKIICTKDDDGSDYK